MLSLGSLWLIVSKTAVLPHTFLGIFNVKSLTFTEHMAFLLPTT